MITFTRDSGPMHWEDELETTTAATRRMKRLSPMPVASSRSASKAQRRARSHRPKSGLDYFRVRRQSSRKVNILTS